MLPQWQVSVPRRSIGKYVLAFCIRIRAGLSLLDPALSARAEAARALLRNDPGVDRLLVIAAVVAPRDPVLSQARPQGREWRRTLNREAVERLFELRDQGVSFGTIAKDFRV